MHVPLTIPSIKQSDIDNVVSVLRSGKLVQGPQVEMLEAAVASYVGVKHAVAVSNGTATLHLALLSLGIGPGDEVIVPAFSYVATANVVELVGAKPIFVDICLGTFNIDASLLENAISDKTKAIIPVHEFGYPADMETILNIANKYSIPIIEDAACALGSEYRGEKVGSLGLIGSFSLHPRKAITSGEGGLITTNNDEIDKFFRCQRNHGIQKNDTGIDFASAGFNYRMTDIQAALVMGQLERIGNITEKRDQFAERYNKNINNSCITKPSMPVAGKTSWQSYHIMLEEGINQNQFISYLRKLEIEANYGAQCIPVQKFYAAKYLYSNAQFPNAYKAYTQGVVLPLFDQMSEIQCDFVIQSVNLFGSRTNDKQ
jgi:perosamine synthetase